MIGGTLPLTGQVAEQVGESVLAGLNIAFDLYSEVLLPGYNVCPSLPPPLTLSRDLQPHLCFFSIELQSPFLVCGSIIVSCLSACLSRGR